MKGNHYATVIKKRRDKHTVTLADFKVLKTVKSNALNQHDF